MAYSSRAHQKRNRTRHDEKCKCHCKKSLNECGEAAGLVAVVTVADAVAGGVVLEVFLGGPGVFRVPAVRAYVWHDFSSSFAG